MNTLQRLGIRRPLVPEPTTWDWRTRDYIYRPTSEDGTRARVSYWTDGGFGSPQFDGRNPRAGDYLILRSPTSEDGSRYQVVSIEQPSLTCTMRNAELQFAPRPGTR